MIPSAADILDKLSDIRFHAGIGFAQAYLPSGARLHLWRPDYPVEAESFGLRHNHRFDMKSTVLCGTVIHTPFTLLDRASGKFQRYTVLAAHHGVAEPPKLVSDDRYAIMVEGVEVYHAGESYTFPKREFHQSAAVGVTMTLMEKSNQEDFRAEIVAQIGQTPKHGLDHKVTQQKVRTDFWFALDSLPPAALAQVLKHLEPK
jgi:hypothetical protein